ncbi:hypothetical protein ACTXT7_000209 [Hymenolepis weldensis]
MNDIQAAVQIWYDEAILDHRIQIGGLSMIMDLSDLRKEDVIKMFDPKASRLATKFIVRSSNFLIIVREGILVGAISLTLKEECLPFRIKKVIYYNSPKIFEAMFKVMSEWLTDKIKSRVMMIGTDMNQAFDALPGLKDIMPECYGGNVKMTFEELCEKHSAILKAVPDHNDDWAISVDESKRPKECKNLFGYYKDLSDDLMGKSGTYVKLNEEI